MVSRATEWGGSEKKKKKMDTRRPLLFGTIVLFSLSTFHMLLSRCYCLTLLQRRALSTIAARATTSSHIVKSSTGKSNNLRPSEYELRVGFGMCV